MPARRSVKSARVVRGAKWMTWPRAPTTRTRSSLRLPRSVSSGLYKFSEKTSVGQLTTSPVMNVASLTSSGGVLTFSLSQLANHAAYAALFDLYKIDKVEVQILPGGNIASTGNIGGPTGASIPMLYISPNKDYFIPPPATQYDVLNDDGAMCLSMDRPRKFTIYQPRAAVTDTSAGTVSPDPVYSTGIVANNVQTWYQTGGNAAVLDQSSLKHYGFRWYVDNSNNASPFIPTIIYTIHASFKERD